MLIYFGPSLDRKKLWNAVDIGIDLLTQYIYLFEPDKIP